MTKPELEAFLHWLPEGLEAHGLSVAAMSNDPGDYYPLDVWIPYYLDMLIEDYLAFTLPTCYCVCHSSVASCPACMHCRGVNMVVTAWQKRHGLMEDVLTAAQRMAVDLRRWWGEYHPDGTEDLLKALDALETLENQDAR